MVKRSSNQESLTLFLSFLITAAAIAGGLWYFRKSLLSTVGQLSQPLTQSTLPQSRSAAVAALANLKVSLPDPATLTIDGSVTMVVVMKQLQIAYSLQNPALPTTYGIPDGKPNGSNSGLKSLMKGKVWVAASSRLLKSEELNQGIVGVPIARDALAVAVGIRNPYRGGLTMQQLKGIFQGRITNWSQVGGPDLPIRVLNRAADSGTQSLFRDVVLLGAPFARDGAGFITAKHDATTPLLRALGNNGITYSTVSQIENQKTVRIVPVDGISPTDQTAVQQGTYPISRAVYLAIRQTTSPAAKQFIELALSPQGQQIVQRSGFIPLYATSP